jgi:2'-5' RNA ligase
MTWLVPAEGPLRDQLLATIDRLAAAHDAPRFPPHITLAPTFDSATGAAAPALRSLVADTPPVDVALTAVGHEPTYFRALYLVAEPSALVAPGSWRFTPHLSLLYSDVPEATKRAIVSGLGIPLPLTVRFDAVELWARDDPEVRSWYRVARVALAGRGQHGAR